MNEVEAFQEGDVFESQSEHNGHLYWLASNFVRLLGYKEYSPTMQPIQRAIQVCCSSGIDTTQNFTEYHHSIDGHDVRDFRLTRFACYLVAMNADVKKTAVAQLQSYFAAFAVRKDIKRMKGLDDKATLFDFMGAEELGANIFRITQTEAKIKREGITGQAKLEQAANDMGKVVRNAIKATGGTMPENLAAEENIKKVRSDLKKTSRVFIKQDTL